MRFINFLAVFLACLLAPAYSTSNNLTDLVEWDKYSLTVNGDRTFILAAEFHYQRLPVPELWLDVFQKFRAEGFNAISVYFFWSFHSPSKDAYDFKTAAKNIQKLFDYAKQAGLWVIARAGPYCNAETNGGGFALYLSDGSGGRLRTGDETYHEQWLPWITKVGNIIAKNQITNGGPVILNQHENELQETVYDSNNTLVVYMEQIKAAFRDAGILVPSTHNEKGERSVSWSTDYNDVGGAVNVYGLDSYPGGLSCTNPDTGFNLVRNYYQWFQNYSYTQPEYFPEFEGGYFSPWGAEAFYDDCATELSPEFPDVYYKNNVGQKATLMSFYMTFGGTNWGHSGAPVVYTSYDYSAPLRETREIRDKLKQIKLLGLFTRVSNDLLTTYMEGNGTGYSVSDNSIWSWVLRNPTIGAGFYTLQHNTSQSRDSTTFSVYANTSAGPVTIPDVNLNGRQSKIIVTDYSFGKHTLLYSSGEVLSYASFDRQNVIALYLDIGQTGTFAFKGNNTSRYKVFGVSSDFRSVKSNGTSGYTYTQGSGATVVKFSNGALFYLLDRQTAWNFHAVPTVDSPHVEPDQQILVIGPHLVRSAKASGSSISITGDITNATSIEVFAGSSRTNRIIWNSQHLPTTLTSYGSLKASIPRPHLSLSLPTLRNWRTADSLPETKPTYDDSAWPICNKNTTLSPYAPITLPVLFASDYGFYPGAKLYRGYFPSSNATSVNLTLSNGVSAGWSAWLNGHFLHSYPGNASVGINSAVIPLPRDLLVNRTGANGSSSSTGKGKRRENVLTVLVGYSGHDETSTAKGVENPRGLLGAQLVGSTFSQWRIRGAAPASLDPVRGPMNEGGLYGERMGWHLPGFPHRGSQWTSGSPGTGIKKPGVQWYSTTARLDIPSGWDVPLGLEMSSPEGTTARIGVWVNGYLMGKYVPHLGPQTRFPVPPGVWDTKGENQIDVAIWAMEEGEASVDVTVFEYGRYASGFELGFRGDEGLRPGFEGGREKYA